MFRIIKFNGKWVIVNGDGTYIFAIVDVKDEFDRSSEKKYEFIPLLTNITYNGEKALFKCPPVYFDTEEAGEVFVEKHFSPLFEGLE
jgi:hypothetical protein